MILALSTAQEIEIEAYIVILAVVFVVIAKALSR